MNEKISEDSHSSDKEDHSPPVTRTTKATETSVSDTVTIIPSTLEADLDGLERHENPMQASPARTVTPPYMKRHPEPTELYSNFTARIRQIAQRHQPEEPIK